MYVQTDDTGRVLATTDREEYAEGMQSFDFPEGFNFVTQKEYRIVDGELIHDPLPEPVEYQIAALKEKLSETDYVVIKMYEAQLSGTSIMSEDSERYSKIIEQRIQWREEINKLDGIISENEASVSV